MRPSLKLIHLLAVATVTLIGFVTINTVGSAAQETRQAMVVELENRVADLGEELAATTAEATAGETTLVHYRALLRLQDAAFADREGFLE